MQLYTIENGNFKLDGGAMFGVVPKSIWQKTNPADSNNMVDIATRSLLIEKGNRLVLIDAGMGKKQSEKFFKHFYRDDRFSLENSMNKKGFSVDDVTDVFLTHLHFDHCGGVITNNKEKLVPVFKNAKIWTNQSHFDWAINPNPREKASFLEENILPIKENGQLNFVENTDSKTEFGFDIEFVSGHTEKQMLPVVNYKNKTILFAGDLFPTVGHVPIPYITSYDTRPLLSMKEKQEVLQRSFQNDWLLFFEHDPINQLANLKMTEKGIRINHIFTFAELFTE